MKLFSLLPVLLLSVCVLSARGAQIDYPEQGITFGLTVERYEPLIVIRDGQVDDWPLTPAWWPAYDALKNYRDGRSYADWVKYFSPEWVERKQLSPARFEAMKRQPPNAFSNPPLQTALYAVGVTWGERQFLVVKLANALVETCPDNVKDLGVSTTTLVFERAADGTWQNQIPAATGFVMEIPYDDLAKVETILRAGRVIYHHGMHPADE
ncbi:MAG: hypothetical protein Q7Q73_12815 [Verrucomicrobiota bacterium JB024]|nr:hypothetical protein [Verrucomicrobiota bacterium JB024]